MGIDLNDEIQVWGGFTQRDLNLVGGVLILLFFVFVLGVAKVTGSLMVGLIAFLSLGGPWVAFALYRRDLPKGYLLRRFRQEGKFLFFTFRGLGGADVYEPPCTKREKAWGDDWEEGREDD